MSEKYLTDNPPGDPAGNADNAGNAGKIKVSPDAVASIVEQAVAESYGVVGTSPVSTGERLKELIYSGSHRGVNVNVREGAIYIDLHIIIEYGTRISEVAANLMEAVKFKVESALDVPVVEVNVHVQGLRVSNYD